MRREILFRGKRKDYGTWVEGYYVHNFWNDGKDTIHLPDGGSCVVNPETVCQYTGYIDFRKKKAFEHDIIFYEDRQCHGHIVFKDGCFLIEWEEGREDLKSDIHFWFTERRVYVVGNVFDNPELLNQ